MVWDATGSDTGEDSFKENMSLKLYDSFLENISKGINLPIYLSLAHYPRLKGKGEAGIAEKVYIDGNTLKASGYFIDTPLGVSVYNAIREDRRNQVSADKKTRISIGFYDRMHRHSNGKVWEYKSGKLCKDCEKGVGGKTYLEGILEHFAVTRVPVNKRTDIVAKSESENMTTRYEDALSIVKNPDILEPIELALIEERSEKSESTPDLIEKAVAADIVAAPKPTTFELLSGLPHETLLKLLNKMEYDGTITSDELSESINALLNQTEEKSTATVSGLDIQADKPEKKIKDVPVTSDETERLNDIAGTKVLSVVSPEWEDVKPLDGAVTFSEADAYVEKIGLTENVYEPYSIFGALAANIINSKSEAKLASLETLLSDFSNTVDLKEITNMSKAQDLTQKAKSDNDADDEEKDKKLKKGADKAAETKNKSDGGENPPADGGRSTADTQPDIVKVIAQAEALIELMRQLVDRPASVATTGTPVGPEPKGSFDENSPISTVVTQFSEAFKSASAKTGDERLAGYQSILDGLGAQMKEVHLSISAKEGSTVSKSEGVQDLSEFVNRALDEKLAPITASLASLADAVRGINAGQATVSRSQQPNLKVEVPKMKSIVNATAVPQSPQKKMSIFDIATATTIGH